MAIRYRNTVWNANLLVHTDASLEVVRNVESRRTDAFVAAFLVDTVMTASSAI